MKIQLKHHYGWETYEVKARTKREAAYLAVRKRMDWLTDDNHTYEIKHGEESHWGGKLFRFNVVRILRNEKSTPRYMAPPAWLDIEPEVWFSVEYK